MAKYGTVKYGTVKYGTEVKWIFNRTINDLLNNTELSYYNYTDLNRIESRMQELTSNLNEFGYSNTIETKLDWLEQFTTSDISNFPMKTQMERIINNLHTLINSYFVYPTTPDAPTTLENLTIYKANDLEKILYDMYNVFNNMIRNTLYCNTVVCGGDYL